MSWVIEGQMVNGGWRIIDSSADLNKPTKFYPPHWRDRRSWRFARKGNAKRRVADLQGEQQEPIFRAVRA